MWYAINKRLLSYDTSLCEKFKSSNDTAPIHDFTVTYLFAGNGGEVNWCQRSLSARLTHRHLSCPNILMPAVVITLTVLTLPYLCAPTYSVGHHDLLLQFSVAYECLLMFTNGFIKIPVHEKTDDSNVNT